MKFLDKSLIILKETILYHVKLYFLRKNCNNCKHLCIRVDYDRFHYYSCNLANKNFILKGSARKKKACTMWEADKETVELINIQKLK